MIEVQADSKSEKKPLSKSLGNNYLNDFALKIGFDIKRIENELRYRTLVISTVSHPILEVHSGSMNRSFLFTEY